MSDSNSRACPKCLKPLAPVRTEDAMVLGCPSCRGVWLDNATCQKLTAGRISSSTVQVVARVDAGAGARPDAADPSRKLNCPVCGSPMAFVRTPFDGVCLDVCQHHGTWFDPNELRAIAQAIAIKEASDDAFVANEIGEMREAETRALMNRTPLGRLINFLR